MIDLNYEEVKKRERELIHFNGWLPFQFFNVVDMLKRNQYLKREGLFKEIQSRNIMVRRKMASGDTDKVMERYLREWVRDNPRFRDCVLLD